MNNAAIICVANAKGGVGKTSLCANLGAYFAHALHDQFRLLTTIVRALSAYKEAALAGEISSIRSEGRPAEKPLRRVVQP